MDLVRMFTQVQPAQPAAPPRESRPLAAEPPSEPSAPSRLGRAGGVDVALSQEARARLAALGTERAGTPQGVESPRYVQPGSRLNVVL